jgi:hypothetical protein
MDARTSEVICLQGRSRGSRCEGWSSWGGFDRGIMGVLTVHLMQTTYDSYRLGPFLDFQMQLCLETLLPRIAVQQQPVQ